MLGTCPNRFWEWRHGWCTECNVMATWPNRTSGLHADYPSWVGPHLTWLGPAFQFSWIGTVWWDLVISWTKHAAHVRSTQCIYGSAQTPNALGFLLGLRGAFRFSPIGVSTWPLSVPVWPYVHSNLSAHALPVRPNTMLGLAHYKSYFQAWGAWSLDIHPYLIHVPT